MAQTHRLTQSLTRSSAWRKLAPLRSSATSWSHGSPLAGRRWASHDAASFYAKSSGSSANRHGLFTLRAALAGTAVAVVTISITNPLHLDSPDSSKAKSLASAHQADIQREDETYKPYRPLKAQPFRCSSPIMPSSLFAPSHP